MDVEFLIQNISKKSPPIAELTEIIGRSVPRQFCIYIYYTLHMYGSRSLHSHICSSPNESTVVALRT